ncbi:17 kDa surface antigen [Tistrella bauzanensis]|uniref:17 kDa surface antigen n=1 Tax=Tistrella bauzanensis TaxID=657419 RepID=A0ABQ1J278_9PROT|nr:RT0821/Lpp0805 family surface protein [Tistrella bauzanensis]GGB58310.1 17 kDa surface antigen [Tistrella bauzanensis]
MKPFIPVIVAAALALGACSSDMGTKEGVGSVLGAVGGAVAGSQFGKGTGQIAAAAVGTLVGAYLGNEVGKSLDRADRVEAQAASQRALESNPTGQSTSWSNPDSGHSGTITPVKTYQNPNGDYCREFTQRVNVGGQTEEAYGTACRQPDGSWRIVNS